MNLVLAVERAAESFHNGWRPRLGLSVKQRLYVLLQNPVAWNGPEPTDDDKQKIFDSIAEDLSRRLLDLASRRVKSERLSDWRSAYDESGPRSTFRRAKLIAERVYDLAAPVPDVTPSRSEEHTSELQSPC